MAHILLVEDDATVGEVVTNYLRRAGHETSLISDGAEALTSLSTTMPDLLILDVMLPGLDGLSLCGKVRAKNPQIPIIMLTALAETEDRIAGLEVGADDYVTKPFSPRELALRVESVLRRSNATTETETTQGTELLTAGDLVVDPDARTVRRGTEELTLTVRELDLLIFLLHHPGKAFSREELMREVWGWTFGDHSTVTVHVRRLREKIEPDPMNPTLIRTVWGIGYRLELP